MFIDDNKVHITRTNMCHVERQHVQLAIWFCVIPDTMAVYRLNATLHQSHIYPATLEMLINNMPALRYLYHIP